MIVVSTKSLIGVKAVIYHTPYGYLNKFWFTTFVPDSDLYAINYEKALKNMPQNLSETKQEDFARLQFTKHINANINP